MRLDGTDWEERFHALLAHERVVVRMLAWPPDGDPRAALAANNAAMLELAREAADDAGFRALLLWNGSSTGATGDTAGFAPLLQQSARRIAIVNPLSP